MAGRWTAMDREARSGRGIQSPMPFLGVVMMMGRAISSWMESSASTPQPEEMRQRVSVAVGDMWVTWSKARTRWRAASFEMARSREGSGSKGAVTGDNHAAVVDLKSLELAGFIETGIGPDGMAWAVR